MHKLMADLKRVGSKHLDNVLKYPVASPTLAIKHSLRISVITTLLFSPLSFAEIEISESLEGLTPEEKAWLLDDSNLEAFAVSSEVLKYSQKASKESYWLSNHLTINPQSLDNGWIAFQQCHNQLDPVPKIEVAYHPVNIKDLHIQTYEKIENVTVKAHSVELINVKKGAKVCIQGQSKTLKIDKEGFKLTRGPYMRKFLDGYYPMIVEETIEMKQMKTQLVEQSPQLVANSYKNEQVKVTQPTMQSQYRFDYAFEGQLKPMYRFSLEQN